MLNHNAKLTVKKNLLISLTILTIISFLCKQQLRNLYLTDMHMIILE